MNIETSHNAVAFSSGREGRSVRFIVIHHWDDPAKNPSFDGVVSWFKNPRAGTSAHYVVEAGRVACLVNEYDTAYHAGNWNMNCQSIGIECNPRCSKEDLQTVRELVADLLTRYPGAKVICHNDVVSTGCPGRYREHISYIAGQGGAPVPRIINDGAARLVVDGIVGRHTMRVWQSVLGTPADGIMSSQWNGNSPYMPAFVDCVEWDADPQGSTFVAALQRRLGVEADGHFGRITIMALQKHLGVTVDGYFGAETARALQTRINSGKF